MSQEQNVAVKGIIRHQDKILLIREAPGDGRVNPGKWDLPGGRIALGEHPADGLRREIMDEVGLEVQIGKPIWLDEWRPRIDGLQRQIVGVFLSCKAKTIEVKLNEDHDEFRWTKLEDTKKLPLMSAAAAALEAYDEYLAG